MAVDEQEQQRKLTAAEQRRLELFERTRDDLIAQGYRFAELTIGIVRASVITVAAAIPILVAGIALFVLVNQGRDVFGRVLVDAPMMLAAVLVLTVVHEGIHGLTWSLFAKNHLADIEFGFMKEYLTPYCTCLCPLERRGYLIGTLAPLVVLGLIPTAVGIAVGSFAWTMIGLVMTLAAGGDVLVAIMLLRHKSDAGECLVYDHPTQAGCVVFER